ncbi:MAG: T9SS type A sorting domain-containing protein [Candidatus Eisenbacteria bacterium]|nr:T9SS type A sorting domain-containing protein [Candidatus Eisenbacteria bacterium]
MRHTPSLVSACLLALTMLQPIPAVAQTGFTADAALTYLGTFGGVQRYRYDYTLTNTEDAYGLTAFRVFFNSSPTEPFAPTGDYATLVSYAAPAGWNDVYVQAKNEFGQWYIEWNYEFSPPPDPLALGAGLSGFSVVFDWTGPDLLPSAQHAQASNGEAYSGQTNVALGSITGVVTGACGGANPPLQGITVDLFFVDNGLDVLVATMGTNASGSYEFPGLPLGEYRVVIVTPLGYVADPQVQTVSLTGDAVSATASFATSCISITAEPRTIGYWKHQVNVYLTGKGKAQETLSDMIRFVDLIVEHFNENIVNPVIIYDPSSGGTTLQKMQQLLTVNMGGTMLDRAKQQMLALLLNVVSGKISQTQVISPNGATVSQAITYANDLITDANVANDETAKTIADIINNGRPVPSGMVPASTRVITYRNPVGPAVAVQFGLAAPYPNPARGTNVSINFSVSRSGPVELRLYDVTGRNVRVLARGGREPGNYSVTWDGRDDTGNSVASGVYYCRLTAPEGMRSRSFAVMR